MQFIPKIKSLEVFFIDLLSGHQPSTIPDQKNVSKLYTFKLGWDLHISFSIHIPSHPQISCLHVSYSNIMQLNVARKFLDIHSLALFDPEPVKNAQMHEFCQLCYLKELYINGILGSTSFSVIFIFPLF